MKVGVLGRGDVAKALANGFVRTGHSVRLGTRATQDPELLEWAKAQGPSLSIGSFAETARFGDVVVLATKGSATGEVVAAAGPAHFAGKVLIDVTNPLVVEGNGPPTLSVGWNSSAGEQLQALLPEAKVVKAFNIVGNPTMFRPKLEGGPPDMFICGNDAAAKATVGEILGEFGWPKPIDIGGIEGAREMESLCILWVKAAFSLGNFGIAFKVLR